MRDRTWEGLKGVMIGRFGEQRRGSIFERLTTNRQTGTIDEYIRDFEILVGQTKGLTDKQQLGYFLAGLQDSVRDLIRPHDPQELLAAMQIAKDVENIPGGTKIGGGNVSRSQISGGRSVGAIIRVDSIRNEGGRAAGAESVGSRGGEGSSGRNASAGGNETMGRGVRNLPYHEYLKRREEGHCFRCGGQFGPGHRCPERSLRVTILGEDEEEDLGETKKELENARLELSLLYVGGMIQLRTMKLLGSLGDREVLIMADSGASHNFISKALVEELQLEVNKDQMHPVCLGDGY